jgi:predicted RNA binding protein YcfA (HicA-like mRNA interferase family)
MKEKEIPTATGVQIVRAFQNAGWAMVRQKGSHVRLQKHTAAETLKLTIPAHRPVKRSTLAHILKQANISVDDFLRLV